MLRALILALALPVFPLASTASTPCEQHETTGRAAFAAGDEPGLQTAYAAALRPCPAEADVLRFLLAGLRFNQALALNQTGAPVARQEDALHRVLEVMPLWQAHAALGDIAATRGDHAEATRQYQDALDAIASTSLTPVEPPEAVIARVFHLAQTSRLLALDYVPTTRSARGQPGGLAAPSIRSFGVTRVALPIQFQFDSTDFTEVGAAAAGDLADYLRAQGDGPITLVGHADPSGTAEYNRRLSLRRAEAVRDFLTAQGLSAPVSVEGRGQDDPFQPASVASLTTDQLNQMHRRVELLRH